MDSNNHTISSLSEKDLIERIIKLSQSSASTLKNDYFNLIGDDCSVILFEDKYLISTSDMLIEQTHFPKEMSFFDMGFKAVTVNVSDLASMGAKPLGILISIGLYKDLKISEFDEIYRGILSGCDYYNIPLLGGDTNNSDEIIITGTAIGFTEKKPMMKYGFNLGDNVCITDKVGLASLGFHLLKKGYNFPNNNQNNKIIIESINKALKPIAKMSEGQKLLDMNVKIATDITDGLASELKSLIEADKKYFLLNNQTDKDLYNKGFRIYEEKLDITSDYLEITDKLNLDKFQLQLNIGEDFELLFIIPPNMIEDLKEDLDFKIIGEVTDKNTLEIVLSNGNIKKLDTKGYDHFNKY